MPSPLDSVFFFVPHVAAISLADSADAGSGSAEQHRIEIASSHRIIEVSSEVQPSQAAKQVHARV